MWIAFELYLWGIEHNLNCISHPWNLVVNCFWIVSLRYWTQLVDFLVIHCRCCELLLNCIFEVLNTTTLLMDWFSSVLWIAFELYLWGIEHNSGQIFETINSVVNCFWIVSLRYWTQLWPTSNASGRCCELLLNCIFEVLNTTLKLVYGETATLWIAFELYLWGIEHNKSGSFARQLIVVNCFWIVSLRYWTQPPFIFLSVGSSCELLLNCIFEVLNTTPAGRLPTCQPLWIAFELYLWGIEHNIFVLSYTMLHVVNCFWIVSLRYWTQQGPLG